MAGYSTGSSSSQQSTQMVPGMMNVYNQLLGLNQNNYQNMLNAYTAGGQTLAGQLPNIYQGYGGLQNQIMGTLGMGQVLGKNGNWGVAAPAAQAIGQTFAQQRGATDQQMINAGLGNTTVRGNLQNQNALMAGQAYGGLGAQLAQTAAGYQAQTGLAGLSAQLAGAQMQSNFTNEYGQALAHHTFSNTAGSLTGGVGDAHSTNQAGGGGGMGGGMSGLGGDFGGGSAHNVPFGGIYDSFGPGPMPPDLGPYVDLQEDQGGIIGGAASQYGNLIGGGVEQLQGNLIGGGAAGVYGGMIGGGVSDLDLGY